MIWSYCWNGIQKWSNIVVVVVSKHVITLSFNNKNPRIKTFGENKNGLITIK